LPTIADFDARLEELVKLTGIGQPELRDFLKCTKEQQEQIVQNYKDMDWTKSPNTFAKVLEVIDDIASVAAAVPILAPYAAGAAAALAVIRMIQNF
jgi:hypothetical protein